MQKCTNIRATAKTSVSSAMAHAQLPRDDRAHRTHEAVMFLGRTHRSHPHPHRHPRSTDNNYNIPPPNCNVIPCPSYFPCGCLQLICIFNLIRMCCQALSFELWCIFFFHRAVTQAASQDGKKYLREPGKKRKNQPPGRVFLPDLHMFNPGFLTRQTNSCPSCPGLCESVCNPRCLGTPHPVTLRLNN